MRLALAILALLAPVQALAWSDAGHKIIASIAFRQLTPAEQSKVAALIRAHPRFAEDFAKRMPEDVAAAEPATQNEWLFQQASVWPDIARGFQGTDRERFHRATWHYANRPHFLSDADRAKLEPTLMVNLSVVAPLTAEQGMNIVQTIRLARRAIASPDVPDGEKGLMLAWLFHGVGDLHQPFHSAALFTPGLFPNGDRGGNGIETQQRGNLHALWDGLLGGRSEFRPARNRAIELIAHAEMASLGEAASMDLNEERWLDESHQLVRSAGYDPEVVAYLRAHEPNPDDDRPPLLLTETYLKAAGNVATKQVVRAGHRLGAVLKEAVRE